MTNHLGSTCFNKNAIPLHLLCPPQVGVKKVNIGLTQIWTQYKDPTPGHDEPELSGRH